MRYIAKDGTVKWRCSVRNKVYATCSAIMDQTGEDFCKITTTQPSPKSRGIDLAFKITTQVKAKCKEDLYRPAPDIVDEVLMQEISNPTRPLSAVPAPGTLAWTGNQKRQRNGPRHPTDFMFKVQEEQIPADFFHQDVEVSGRRHLLFASNKQLELLAKGKTWCMDGTFRVVKEPFKQIF